MKPTRLIGMTGLLVLLLGLPVLAQEQQSRSPAGTPGKMTSRQASDIEFLSDFEIIIGDLGERYSDWDRRDTRVYVEVYDGRRYRDHYFDNLPAMMFVLRERYNRARITDLAVPEYAGLRHEEHGHEGHGLIDGRRAWYLWDYEHYSRGGTPLVLAFSDYDDARREARYRDADILDYEDLIWRLNDWAERAYDRVYWRGWDADRWSERERWDWAWNRRFEGARWDPRYGWTGIELNLGDFNIRWDTDDDVFRRDRYGDRDRYYRRGSSEVEDEDEHDGDEDHDRGHGNDEDGRDDDNPGRGRGSEDD